MQHKNKISAGSADKVSGFTLLEVLIALFIFTILSMIMVSALRTVIDTQSHTEEKALRLRELQWVLLIVSRDVEQTVSRGIMDAAGKQEVAFIGAPDSFTCTHAGFANIGATLASSRLQRVRYTWHNNTLWRLTWQALDQAPQSKAAQRALLTNVSAVHFQYLDASGRFHAHWPVADKSAEILPRAVRISLTILQWGEISQLYVIAAQNNNIPAAPTQS